MKGLFLRVGIDTGYGGTLAPIFKDGTFEYIPIPEKAASEEEKIYSEMTGRVHDSVEEFVPDKIKNYQPHFDPEFETYTYGESSSSRKGNPSSKRSQLLDLEEDELLLFYAGLRPWDFDDEPRLYAIGYFTVDKVYNFRKMDPKEEEKALKKLQKNAHVKKRKRREDLVIVKGKPEKSELFTRARLIGTPKDKLLPSLENIFGYDPSKSIQRSIGRWIDTEYLPKVKNWLEQGFSSLITDDTKLYSYVIPHDTGFAPNVTGGYCTLATCKHRIRDWADLGDWIIGTGSKQRNDKKSRLLYAMRVEETKPYNEYFNDERFQIKKPQNDPKGDNIYYKENKKLIQHSETEIHTTKEEKQNDLKTDKVLISSLYWYFGQKEVKIPQNLKEKLIKKGTGCKSIKDQKILKNLINWIETNHRPGTHQKPRDTNSNKIEERKAHCKD